MPDDESQDRHPAFRFTDRGFARMSRIAGEHGYTSPRPLCVLAEKSQIVLDQASAQQNIFGETRAPPFTNAIRHRDHVR
jgi:hypothetical protein